MTGSIDGLPKSRPDLCERWSSRLVATDLYRPAQGNHPVASVAAGEPTGRDDQFRNFRTQAHQQTPWRCSDSASALTAPKASVEARHRNGLRPAYQRRADRRHQERICSSLPAGRVDRCHAAHVAATWLMQAGTDPWQAAGSLSMSMETLLRVYGHHHPDYQRQAAENIGRRPQNVRVIA
jgi:hypothetical protein